MPVRLAACACACVFDDACVSSGFRRHSAEWGEGPVQTVGMSCAREVPGKGHQHSLRDVGAQSLRGRAPPAATLWSVSARGTVAHLDSCCATLGRHLLRSQSGSIAPLSARMLASPSPVGCAVRHERPPTMRCDALDSTALTAGQHARRMMFCVRSGPHCALVLDSEGYVLNADGKRAPMVHQWDRCSAQDARCQMQRTIGNIIAGTGAGTSCCRS